MKRLTIAALLALGMATAFTAATLQLKRYESADGNLVVTFQELNVVQLKDALLNVRGTVRIVSKSQGMTIEGDAIQAKLPKNARGKYEVREATATGHVRVVKSVNSAAQALSTEIKGSKGVMRFAESGNRVDLSGPVTLINVDRKKRQTMTATGASLVAFLAPSGQGEQANALRTAKMSGPVRVVIVQAPEKGQTVEDSTVVATADRMDVDNTASQPVVTLVGHVNIHGEGKKGIGKFTGLQRASMRLNDKGEFMGFSTEAG